MVEKPKRSLRDNIETAFFLVSVLVLTSIIIGDTITRPNWLVHVVVWIVILFVFGGVCLFSHVSESKARARNELRKRGMLERNAVSKAKRGFVCRSCGSLEFKNNPDCDSCFGWDMIISYSDASPSDYCGCLSCTNCSRPYRE